MNQHAPYLRQGDGRLWVIALLLSLLVNVGVLGIAGFTILKTQTLRKSQRATQSPQQAYESTVTTVTIFPELAAAEAVPVNPRFVRASDDQTAVVPEKTPFIGERNTQATSDRSPDPTAPALPSQAGMDRNDLETTESRYQDGKLGDDQPAMPQDSMPAAPSLPTIPDPAMAEKSTAGQATETPGTDTTDSVLPPAEKLLLGTSPVDVPTPQEQATQIKPTPAKRPAPKPAADPGFKGYQRKAAIVGSISRTGRSALDVVDSPLGRYQAVISRAVELEWQRNCMRHRDFITPGFLTVRFFVESSGKVRTVQFVGAMETGEVQKGFTLNSIRNAGIPAMPAAVKKDFAGEPLELIFNFYF